MVTLAVDTSHPEGSVSLAVDGAVVGYGQFGANASHLVELGARVDRLLKQQRLEIGEVARVALVEGPGSFTGLRVGMAYVKGLAAALDVSVVTVGTLELLAMPLLRPRTPTVSDSTGAKRVCPMVDARKGEVYAAVFERGGDSSESIVTLVEPRAESPERILEMAERFRPTFLGTGAIHYRQLVERAVGADRVAPERTAIPSTPYLCQIAAELRPLSRDAIRTLEPFYIRASDAVFTRLKPIEQHG